MMLDGRKADRQTDGQTDIPGFLIQDSCLDNAGANPMEWLPIVQTTKQSNKLYFKKSCHIINQSYF
jgi:hypothetical protein